MIVRDRFIEVEGGRICYQIRKGKEKALVFLHGGGGSISSWGLIRPYFATTDYTLLYIDLRGHGRSFRPKSWEEYKIERKAEDIKDIIRLIGPMRQIRGTGEKVILIGHCLGAMVAATFAALYPKKVEKLVLINPGEKRVCPFFPAMVEKGTTILYSIVARLRRDEGGEEGWRSEGGEEGRGEESNLSNQSNESNETNRRQRVDYKKFQGSHDLSLRRIWADVRAMGWFSALAQARAFFAWEGKKYFSKLNLPTLIIGGKRDIIFPPEVTEKVVKMIKDTKLEMIESNHISVINNPKEVWKKILKFLNCL